jgi:tetratricopeptide (TPR) repeat protein
MAKHTVKNEVNIEQGAMIKPKPPVIIQEIQWVLMYGKKYWKLLFITLAVLGIFVSYRLVPIFFSGKNQGQHSESKTNGNFSPANTATGPNSSVNNTYNIYGGENNILKETKLIDTYEQDTKINPNNIFTWLDLAHLYIKLNYYDKAIKACNQAIRIDPNCTGAYNHLGFAYCKLGRWQKAIEVFKQAIKIDPCDVEAYGNLGVAYCKLGRYEEAVETFKRTIKLKPDSDETYNDWGRVLGDLVQKQEGIAFQQSLSEANEMFLRAESIKTGMGAYGLACVCALRNDKAGCQKWLEVSEQVGMLPMRKFVMDSNSLKSVFNEDWFLQIYWSDDPN